MEVRIGHLWSGTSQKVCETNNPSCYALLLQKDFKVGSQTQVGEGRDRGEEGEDDIQATGNHK